MKAGFVAARTSCPFGIGHSCLQTKPGVHGSPLGAGSAEVGNLELMAWAWATAIIT